MLDNRNNASNDDELEQVTGGANLCERSIALNPVNVDHFQTAKHLKELEDTQKN